MKIKTRLAIWYTLAFVMALSLIASTIYYEIFIEHPVLDIRWRLQAAGETPEGELGEALLFAGVPVAILAIVGGWFLIRRALSPVTKLTEALERIQADDLRTKITRSGNGDELDRLTDVFNAMMGRLETSFSNVREFTLHASHELRTPLTIMRGELETALHDEELSPTHQARIASQLEEVLRLTQIVDSLNFLAKVDAGLLQFEKTSVHLGEIMQDACTDARVLAEPQQITVEGGPFPAVVVNGDRRRLRQLLLILTDNAIKYNHEHGTVKMSLHVENKRARLSVTNTGPGVPSEIRKRVFDRFFRGDTSRNHEEGSGLGLSIARSIVHAHDGEIELSSQPEETKVTVALTIHDIGLCIE